MITLAGHLAAYWEQGMEGRIEYAFAPDHTRHPEAEPLIFLKNGDPLEILDEEGNLLWSGKICFVSRRRWLFFYEQHELPNGIWHSQKQQGVAYKDWMAWFWHKPPLAALLQIPVSDE